MRIRFLGRQNPLAAQVAGGLVLLLLSGPALAILNKAQRDWFDVACSKWIARDSRGVSYVLRVAGGLSLRTLRGRVGLSRSVPLPQGASGIVSAGIAVDRADRLHLFWNTGAGAIRYSIADVRNLDDPADLGHPERWRHPEIGRPGSLAIAEGGARIGDLGADPAGVVWLAWSVTDPGHRVSLSLGALRAGRWVASRLAEGDGWAPPRLLVDRKGAFHLAWHDIYEEAYSLTGDLAGIPGKAVWPVRRLAVDARRPALVEAGNRTLSVVETNYSALDSLFLEDAQGTRVPLTGRDARFPWDTCHSPEFTVDRYGIPWLFFIDSARQHVFFTRWLGERWSPFANSFRLVANTPRVEENHLSIDRLSVEPEMTPGGSGIALALTHEGASPRQDFVVQRVPSLEAKPGKKVLFLDLLELKRLDGLVLKVNPARKHEGNPVVSTGAPDEFDAERGGNFLRVLKEDGRYRMWYAGLRSDPDRPWWEWYRVGYAESRDGRAFHKVRLGLASFGNRNDTNIIPDLPYVPMVAVDPSDPVPDRRYKLLKTSNSGVQKDEARAGRLEVWKEVINGTLFTSPDGIHWKATPAEVNFPAGRPFSFIPQSLFRDLQEADPARRFKAYGFSSLNLARRGGAFAYSPDALHWTASTHNPVLDPFGRDVPVVRGGKVHQIHDTVVWPYGGYYLAFYQYQVDGARQDVELAVSRDGENFVFVGPGQKVIPTGPAGGWECDEVTPSVPIVDGGEIKLYYGGGCGERGAGGLSTLRLDGFTDLELDAGRAAGSLVTVPIRPAGAAAILLNADCGKDGSIRAGLLDAKTGDPIPGYSPEDSIPVSGDSAAHILRWKDGPKPARLPKSEFLLKLSLSGTAGGPKLYAIAFQ